MRQLLAGMSLPSGVRQAPRLRAETHFGVQARALPVGLHRLEVGIKTLAYEFEVLKYLFLPHDHLSMAGQ